MSALYDAPGLRRAQLATPAFSIAPQGSSIPMASRPARVTRRALAVAAATLCAPLVAASALAAIGAATGGDQPAMGTLAGSQGLRGTTVGVSSPAPSQVPAPAGETSKGYGKDDATAATGHAAPTPTRSTPRQPSQQGNPAPTRKPPTQTTPKPRPAPRGGVNPPTQSPAPTYDPTGPGAPTQSGTTGGTTTSGSTTDTSTSGESPDASYGG